MSADTILQIQLAVYKLNSTGSKVSEKSGLDKQSTLHSYMESIPVSIRDPFDSESSINSSLPRLDEAHGSLNKINSAQSSFAQKAKDEGLLKLTNLSQFQPEDDLICNTEEIDELKNITDRPLTTARLIPDKPLITTRLIPDNLSQRM